MGTCVCYNCGKTGHVVKFCPKKQQQQPYHQNPGNPPKGQAKVYALSNQEKDQDPHVLAGNVLIFGRSSYTLFDSSSTHSFVSLNFASKLSTYVEHASTPLEIVMPSGGTVSMNCVVKIANVEIGGQLLQTTLYVLNMKAFDVILGMDWLSKYHATILCSKREIVCRSPEGLEVHHYVVEMEHPPCDISAIKVKKLLWSKGCIGFLMSVVVKGGDELVVNDVKVVKDFLEVFPDDLIEMPPEQEVKFTIDLVLGSAPISKSPYRIAPKELQELKT
ncbi:uncharacterized protein LOC127794784 [Diospyros lotus]|uniref:uncharacterized protein LOC127794784 n=1 Tax=Diospyros lotus TaxID=55363 RepID=UPI00225293DB|nr:uncharacterized protein LOC127794784 [Diospyros lotus]